MAGVKPLAALIADVYTDDAMAVASGLRDCRVRLHASRHGYYMMMSAQGRHIGIALDVQARPYSPGELVAQIEGALIKVLTVLLRTVDLDRGPYA